MQELTFKQILEWYKLEAHRQRHLAMLYTTNNEEIAQQYLLYGEMPKGTEGMKEG